MKVQNNSYPHLHVDDVQTRRHINLVSRPNSMVDPHSKGHAINRIVSYAPSDSTLSAYGNNQHPDPPSSTPEEKWKTTRCDFP